MKYTKGKNNSYLHNSTIKMRPGDSCEGGIFYLDGVDCFARLNGYAIIPMEEYCNLKNIPYDDTNIKKADKELWGK